MAPVRRAIIDVGTNSVKLLVAEVAGAALDPIFETSEQTRLGRGFYDDHRLRPDAIAQTAEAVARFAAEAQHHGSQVIRVVATSAARDAFNRQELLAAIRDGCGLEAEIISGDREAEWAFRGVTSDPRLAGHRLLILDVGGGSAQFVVGQGPHHCFRESVDLGSVRLLEKLRPADPPSLADIAACRGFLVDFFQKPVAAAIEAALDGAGRDSVLLVGTGGTTTFLARMENRMADYDRARIEATVLTRQQVLDWMIHLWTLPLAERKRIVGLPPNRADVILMGVAIFEAVMGRFHFRELRVSTRGLRFGGLLEAP